MLLAAHPARVHANKMGPGPVGRAETRFFGKGGQRLGSELLGLEACCSAGKPAGEERRAKQGYLSTQSPLLAASWEAAALVIYGQYWSCWRRALFGTTNCHAAGGVSQKCTLCLLVCAAVAPVLPHYHFFASWFCEIQHKYADIPGKKSILTSN